MDQRRLLLLACGAILSVACESDVITHVRVAKSAEAAPAAAEPAMAEPGMMRAPGDAPRGDAPGAEAQADDADSPDGLQWVLPAGWTAKRETGMRYATLKPAAAGKVDISVVVLPGPVGGELANVNRWRGQLGLAPIDEAEVAKIRKPMETDAGRLELFDLVSDGQEKSRTLAAVLPTASGNTWFVKMTGNADAVRARQPEFLRMLSSLHFGDGSGREQP